MMYRNVFTLNQMKKGGTTSKWCIIMQTVNQMKEKGVPPLEVTIHYVCNYPQPNEGEGGTTGRSDYSLCM